MNTRDNPLLSKRFYKVKNPKKSFLCALCTAPRSMKYSKRLSWFNYIQMALLSGVIIWLAFPYAGLKSLYSLFITWTLFEVGNKLLYRKEIPCPYCGFDATWYRRDVKKANQMVKNFWAKNYPELVAPKVDEAILNTPNPSLGNQSHPNSTISQEALSH